MSISFIYTSLFCCLKYSHLLEFCVFICLCDQQLNQDFLLLLGAEIASKMLEKWDTTFRPKVINEVKLTENDDTGKLINMIFIPNSTYW